MPLSYILGIYYGFSNPGLWLGITFGNGLLAYLYIKLALEQDWDQIALDVSERIESYI